MSSLLSIAVITDRIIVKVTIPKFFHFLLDISYLKVGVKVSDCL